MRLTVSIRIVADCVALSCQVTQKLKRATTLEFTTISAIIFIHCYALAFLFHLLNQFVKKVFQEFICASFFILIHFQIQNRHKKWLKFGIDLQF